MKTIIGNSNWIIEINLSSGSVASFQVSEKDRRQYLGGRGLGLKLLYERMDRGIDPLGEKNILAFMVGGAMGTGLPCTDGFSAITKSPLTGLMLHSSCGGPFAEACRAAGFEGLLVSGKAFAPTVLVIDPNETHMEDGSAFWGLDPQETQKRLNPDGKSGVLTIGPAGENQVRIANAASSHCFFGRGGLGAVMGAKNLKAIVVRGNAYDFIPSDPKRFGKARKKAFACIPPDRSAVCDQLDPPADRPGMHARQCDIAAMLGPKTGIDDADRIGRFHAQCNRLGLDVISCAAVLAWCMEAGEKGLIDTDLKFGVPAGIETALEEMAYRRGVGDDMADGLRSLSTRYGGKAFALHVKGLEIPAQDPRSGWDQGLGCAVANDGSCHPAAAMDPLEAGFGLLSPHTMRAKARWVKFTEDLSAIAHSLYSCPHSADAMSSGLPRLKGMPTGALKAMLNFFPGLAMMVVNVGSHAKLWHSVSGMKLNRRQLLKVGERIHVLERTMNSREGMSRKDDTLPGRFLEKGREGDDSEVPTALSPMIDIYYRLRGYDLRGIPTTKTLRRLDISSKTPVDADPRLGHFKMVSPGPRRLQRLYLSLILWFMGRAIEAAAKADRQVRDLFHALPDGLTVALTIAPHGPAMVLAKDKKGTVRYVDSTLTDRSIDLTLTIKNIDMAMLLFTLREPIVTAVARDRLMVRGDIPAACIVVRILERMDVLLLPKGLAALSVRRYPDVPTLRTIVMRGVIYLRALAGL